MAKKKAARKTTAPKAKSKKKPPARSKAPAQLVIDESASPLLKVKLALAEKYQSLARCAQGKPKRKAYTYRADKYRRQVLQLSLIESRKKGGAT